LPPEFVPMRAGQQEIEVQTLAVLLDSWLKADRTVQTEGKLPANRRSTLKTSSDDQMEVPRV
jgi:hypothetical protein